MDEEPFHLRPGRWVANCLMQGEGLSHHRVQGSVQEQESRPRRHLLHTMAMVLTGESHMSHCHLVRVQELEPKPHRHLSHTMATGLTGESHMSHLVRVQEPELERCRHLLLHRVAMGLTGESHMGHCHLVRVQELSPLPSHMMAMGLIVELHSQLVPSHYSC